jgi:ribosomal protein L13
MLTGDNVITSTQKKLTLLEINRENLHSSQQVTQRTKQFNCKICNKKKPCIISRKAVKGMLPKTKLGAQLLEI